MKNNRFMFVFVVFTAGLLPGLSGRAYASGAADLLLQDELFFLQEEFKESRIQLVEKDQALQRLSSEKEQTLAREQSLLKENRHLQLKIADLEKALALQHQEAEKVLSRNQGLWQSSLAEHTRKTEEQSLILEQKEARIEAVRKENRQLQLEAGKLRDEKESLQKTLQKLAGESRGADSRCDQRFSRERAGYDKKIADLQSRLEAEKTLVNEKVVASSGQMESRLAALTEELRQTKQKLSESQQKTDRDPRPRVRDIEESARKKVAEAQGVMRLAVKSSLRAERKSLALKKHYEGVISALKQEAAELLKACGKP